MQFHIFALVTRVDVLADLATFFLQRARLGDDAIQWAYKCHTECDLLETLNCSLSAPAMQDCIEDFFQEADVMTAKARKLTPRLRSATQVTRMLCDHILF